MPESPAAVVIEEVPTVAQRLWHLALNAVVFAVAYTFNNVMAQQRGTEQHIATAWDAHVPLLPWLLLPYASSGVRGRDVGGLGGGDGGVGPDDGGDGLGGAGRWFSSPF